MAVTSKEFGITISRRQKSSLADKKLVDVVFSTGIVMALSSVHDLSKMRAGWTDWVREASSVCTKYLGKRRTD